jgi:hypothetical protein
LFVDGGGGGGGGGRGAGLVGDVPPPPRPRKLVSFQNQAPSFGLWPPGRLWRHWVEESGASPELAPLVKPRPMGWMGCRRQMSRAVPSQRCFRAWPCGSQGRILLNTDLSSDKNSLSKKTLTYVGGEHRRSGFGTRDDLGTLT